jgi:hypothetical protein
MERFVRLVSQPPRANYARKPLEWCIARLEHFQRGARTAFLGFDMSRFALILLFGRGIALLCL